jgi:hypothetical protein
MVELFKCSKIKTFLRQAKKIHSLDSQQMIH